MYKIRLQSFFLKFVANDRSDKRFLLTSKFCPLGAVCPCPGLYTCIKSRKKCIKSDFKDIFFKLATNEWSDKTFLFTSKLWPMGAVCPYPGAIYMYKIMKNCIKSDFEENCFKTCNKWPKWQEVSKFCPLELFVPDLRLYTFIKSWKDVY